MTFKESFQEIRTMFSEEFSKFLSEKGLSQVRVLNSGLQLEKRKLSLAVFPTSTTGSTFAEQGDYNIICFTVILYCNSDATENGLAQAEEYYSAVLEFIQTRTFGEESVLDSSIVCRMDEGYPVNGAEFLVSSRISTNCDFGW